MNLIMLAVVSLMAMAGIAPGVKVGSKKFTESVTLGELVRQTLEHDGIPATHRKELGGTRILWNALISGDIDVYAEYTGTLAEEILRTKFSNLQELNELLAEFGVGATSSLGFNNTYAVGMKRELAESLQIRTISDLARHPNLKLGWGEEFRLRKDGWPGLRDRYGLHQRFIRGLDHDIGYRALQTGEVQVLDLYSTDAEIAYYDLRILEDNLRYFPRYEALFLYRLDCVARAPGFMEALSRLSGRISDTSMVSMNRRAKIDKIPSGLVAADFLNETFGWATSHRNPSRTDRVLVRTKEHVKLVVISLILAIFVAVPLGVLSEKIPTLGKFILSAIGVIQTIPALALLVVLIRPLNMMGLSGIGDTPALIALFLYSLLPIVRSTHAGLTQIPRVLRETASVLGLRPSTRLFKIEIPMVMPSILSGIKTSAVMTVGFATLGALVGAGGFGQPILTGIRLDDYGLILEGALPAAALAIIVQLAFDVLETWLVSPGLRLT